MFLIFRLIITVTFMTNKHKPLKTGKLANLIGVTS